MSWLSDIGDAVSGSIGTAWSDATRSVSGIFSGGGVGGKSIWGGLISTAITGFALSKIANSISNSSQPKPTPTPPDTGVNIQLDPNPQAAIPVVYGTSYVSGILTDAVMSNDNTVMYYVLTLCEKTGTKISDNVASSIGFDEIYWNDQRIVFDADGITALYTLDRGSNQDPNISGLVKVYCYNNGSANQVAPTGYSITPVTAYSIIPDWNSNKTMSDLVFAVVKITYNKSKGTTNLPTMTFKLINSMTMPGDCMYDYMTNTRYGAGIPVEDIYSQ